MLTLVKGTFRTHGGELSLCIALSAGTPRLSSQGDAATCEGLQRTRRFPFPALWCGGNAVPARIVPCSRIITSATSAIHHCCRHTRQVRGMFLDYAWRHAIPTIVPTSPVEFTKQTKWGRARAERRTRNDPSIGRNETLYVWASFLVKAACTNGACRRQLRFTSSRAETRSKNRKV